MVTEACYRTIGVAFLQVASFIREFLLLAHMEAH